MDSGARVVIVEDQRLVAEMLRSLLQRDGGFEVVGEASSVGEAVDVVSSARPDVVLLDLQLKNEDGADVARTLRANGATTKILVLSGRETAGALREAMAAGADGYLLKSMSGERLAESIHRTLAGETVIAHELVPSLIEDAISPQVARARMTQRETEVLRLVAEGLSNRHIAEALKISVATAAKHVENLFRKLDVHGRTELVGRAYRAGFLD